MRRFDPEFVRQELAEMAGKKGAYLEQVCVERQALDYIEFLEDVVNALRELVSNLGTQTGEGADNREPSQEEAEGLQTRSETSSAPSPVAGHQIGDRKAT